MKISLMVDDPKAENGLLFRSFFEVGLDETLSAEEVISFDMIKDALERMRQYTPELKSSHTNEIMRFLKERIERAEEKRFSLTGNPEVFALGKWLGAEVGARLAVSRKARAQQISNDQDDLERTLEL